jgi:hypothetical protein
LTATNAALFAGAVPKGSMLELKSPAITWMRAAFVANVTGTRYEYNQPLTDGANLWAPSLCPIKFASGVLDIPRAFKTHINNGL